MLVPVCRLVGFVAFWLRSFLQIKFLYFSYSLFYLFFSLLGGLSARRWDKFEDLYRMMVFSNGDKCWNGPDRSMKVLLHNIISMRRFIVVTRGIPVYRCFP